MGLSSCGHKESHLANRWLSDLGRAQLCRVSAPEHWTVRFLGGSQLRGPKGRALSMLLHLGGPAEPGVQSEVPLIVAQGQSSLDASSDCSPGPVAGGSVLRCPLIVDRGGVLPMSRRLVTRSGPDSITRSMPSIHPCFRPTWAAGIPSRLPAYNCYLTRLLDSLDNLWHTRATFLQTDCGTRVKSLSACHSSAEQRPRISSEHLP